MSNDVYNSNDIYIYIYVRPHYRTTGWIQMCQVNAVLHDRWLGPRQDEEPSAAWSKSRQNPIPQNLKYGKYMKHMFEKHNNVGESPIYENIWNMALQKE